MALNANAINFLDLHRQYAAIKPEIDRAIAGVLERTDFVLGNEVQQFEEEWAAYCQVNYAVGVDNGAAALELGMRALGIGPGDEVLVPANSFMASATAVSATGATPVFVDIDPTTYTIDVRQLALRIGERTRAIMPVHLYGQPAEMGPIMALAKQHDLFVVEDACQAHGARYKGQRVGSFGHVAAFSFYPGKNLGAYGDAGALVTDDPELAQIARMLRNCGQRQKYQHVYLGGNHRLDTLQAAILRVKLRYLDQWIALRRQWAALYDRLLDSPEITTPLVWPANEHVYHLYVVQIEERDGLQSFLNASGIATGIHYPTPIHLQPAYEQLGYRRGRVPVAEFIAPRLLSLPMYPELTAREIEVVADRVQTFLLKRHEPVAQPKATVV